MQIIRELAALKTGRAALGGRVALVPTMGALHAGHIALVEAAHARADHVIASIFVNPTQFAASEDLSSYPRREAEDAAMLDAAGCAALWLPDGATMYPDGFATGVRVTGVSARWEGAARPGHFDGVATVVAKLFAQVRPDLAVFGEKDWQQLAVVRRMTADLDLGIEIVGLPTVREADGVALSSRNAYLSAAERMRAAALPRAVQEAARAIRKGARVESALARARDGLGAFEIDYLALVDAATLEPIDRLGEAAARLIVAARLGRTRLIDNFPV